MNDVKTCKLTLKYLRNELPRGVVDAGRSYSPDLATHSLAAVRKVTK